MIVVTSSTVAGREITAVIGLVRGNTVRSAHAAQDLSAVFQNIVGGEIREYTKLLAEAREQALDRMVAEASARGADAVVDVRLTSCEVARGAAEFLAYGTAVKLGPRP
jgi:uncharacterized protein YbjQ (UPF0145 family)